MMTPDVALSILRAQVSEYTHNRVGREQPMMSRLLAEDALAVLETAVGVDRQGRAA